MRPGQNTYMFDQWTSVHLLLGASAGLVGMKFPATMVAGIVFEGVEQVFERTEFGMRFFDISGPENARNVGGDMLALAVGWGIVYLARAPSAYRRRRSCANPSQEMT